MKKYYVFIFATSLLLSCKRSNDNVEFTLSENEPEIVETEIEPQKQEVVELSYKNLSSIQEFEVADENFPLNPLSLYAKAKVDIEKFILSLKNEKINFEPLILRFATAFGASPRMRFDLTINEFAYELLKGNELVVYDADTWRPYCHVNDFSRLILKVLDDQKNNLKFEIFNVGSDANNFTKRQIAELIADKISGSKVKFKKGDIDPRNYKVNFQKLSKIDFQIKHNVKDEIDELINFIKNNDFKEKKFFGNYEIK